MTTETLAKLEPLKSYASRSLARDHAMDVIRTLSGSERREAERWYAVEFGISGAQDLRSKYGV